MCRRGDDIRIQRLGWLVCAGPSVLAFGGLCSLRKEEAVTVEDIDRAFYELTVAQRNAAWNEIDRLREQNANLIKDVLKQREEVTRLRTVIDNHRHHGTPL